MQVLSQDSLSDMCCCTWQAAEQLARIAAYHGFDGWLINIENSLSTRLLPNLLHFLSHLRARMRELRGAQSAVIW